MIGFSKLLCARTTVAAAMRETQGADSGEAPRPGLLHFSSAARPVVVWNVTSRCNLRCLHCYLGAEAAEPGEELATDEGMALIDDLAQMSVPVLLLSGGEPLLREDVLALAAHAAARGLRTGLSTNGTLIDAAAARSIREAGIQYAGVSLDGMEHTHDVFRRRQGAFQEAVAGIRNCREAGVRTGIRFTLNAHNWRELPDVLDVCEALEVPRFCMYHLVYAGRAREMMSQDVTADQRRQAVQWLIERALDWGRRGVDTEIVTTDNHADGVLLYHYVREHAPERADDVLRLLHMHGGCSAGCKIANIDPRGGVHPCQFWDSLTVGSVREGRFSEIWDQGHPLLADLRRKQELVRGRCGECLYKDVCAGCRIRAQAVHGDYWAEDPACYLSDEEIGTPEE